MRKSLAIAGAALVLIWAGLTAGAYAAMRQPPERFGAIMSHFPMAAMMVLPFERLWMSARAGHVSPGDRAPDFQLPMLDHSRTVRISDEFRDRPVVLIFGSYT